MSKNEITFIEKHISKLTLEKKRKFRSNMSLFRTYYLKKLET